MIEENQEVVTLYVSGMHCTNCAQGIERHLKKLGAAEARVDFSTGRLRVTPSDHLSRRKIRAEVEGLGYAVRERERVDDASHDDSRATLVKLVLSALFTLPLLLHMVVPWHPLHDPWVQLGLSLPVMAIGIHFFGRSAIRSIRAGAANMDVLIVGGSSAAFLYSVIGTVGELGPDFQFYETAATIITAVLLGNVLEQRAVARTTSSIRELSALHPKKAIRILERIDGRFTTEEVESSSIQIGDELLVRQGDRVPADGEVIEGGALVDESMVTGESLPVERRTGSPVIGGTILQQGTVQVRATAVGEATVLAHIIQLVRDSYAEKPKIQRLGDVVSSYFVPAVLAIAVLTFALSLAFGSVGVGAALMRAVAVLVVACPCAMGLATPTAVIMGIGKAAKAGILVKGGATIEDLSRIEKILFDKTGTLTTGSFEVRHVDVLKGSRQEAESLITSLEHHSNHPIARSLVRAFGEAPSQPLFEVQEEAGVGIRGRTAEGSLVLLRRATDEEKAERNVDLVLERDGFAAAGIALADEIKPHARAAIAALKRDGIRMALVSGDSEAKCREVADGVGLDEVYSRHSPEEKLKVVTREEENQPTAFVGDGINDAPTLARAHVGISLSDASQVAVQSAQVVLLAGRIELLPAALSIARRTMRTIKQNLFWAFFYNVLMIPLAAFGYLTPMVAAFSMIGSDLIVIGNSLRLRFSAPDVTPHGATQPRFSNN